MFSSSLCFIGISLAFFTHISQLSLSIYSTSFKICLIYLVHCLPFSLSLEFQTFNSVSLISRGVVEMLYLTRSPSYCLHDKIWNPWAGPILLLTFFCFYWVTFDIQYCISLVYTTLIWLIYIALWLPKKH